MLIVGAKGFAKEVLEVVYKNDSSNKIAFYDDVNDDIGDMLYGNFPILKNETQVKEFFEEFGYEFTIGIGNPLLRKTLHQKFVKLNGVFTSTISQNVVVGSFGIKIESGCNVMQNVVITNDVFVGRGTLINQISSIGHDVQIGSFCEICPNVSISGNCNFGDLTFIGTGAIILPNVQIGKNVTIGAGAVVSKDLPDNCVAVGIPAKIIKFNSPT